MVFYVLLHLMNQFMLVMEVEDAKEWKEQRGSRCVFTERGKHAAILTSDILALLVYIGSAWSYTDLP